MKKNVFVINGFPLAGKDTFCEMCKIYTSVQVVSLVDKVKDIARECGWTGGKSDKDRKFLSNLKDLLSDYSDLPFKDISDKVDSFKNSDTNFLFIHSREPKDIERLVEEFNAVKVLVVNSRVGAVTSNHADTNVMDIDYDYVVHNEKDLKNLNMEAYKFCMKYLLDKEAYETCMRYVEVAEQYE